jgi:hypothetical protein
MKSETQPFGIMRTIQFEPDDFFDQDKMLNKLDRLILAWGEELRRGQYIDHLPGSDEAWLKVLGRDIYWKDLKDPWDCYLAGCLIFFVLLRSDIKESEFLLQPDNIRGQRLQRWLPRTKHYLTPLSQDIITEFCLCYSMILEKKPIKVRYKEFKA